MHVFTVVSHPKSDPLSHAIAHRFNVGVHDVRHTFELAELMQKILTLAGLLQIWHNSSLILGPNGDQSQNNFNVEKDAAAFHFFHPCFGCLW